MKRITFYVFLFITLLSSASYASISESFQKRLTIINVPIENANGYEINEEIFNKYNLIV